MANALNNIGVTRTKSYLRTLRTGRLKGQDDSEEGRPGERLSRH